MTNSSTTSTAIKPILINSEPRCPKCGGLLIGAYSVRYYGLVETNSNGALECTANEAGGSDDYAVFCEECSLQFENPEWIRWY